MTEQELANAKTGPGRIYYARHMQPGLARHPNETVLVDADTMKAMIPSFDGKPIYLNHKANVPDHETKGLAGGWVSSSFYNELDGWAWVKMLVLDDEVIDAIDNMNMSVSNAYVPSDWALAGKQHDVPYDRSIKGGRFTHLAVVSNPRYEQAAIYTPEAFKQYQDSKRHQLNELRNSTDQKKGKPMFDMFKKTTTKEPVTEIDADTMAEFTNSKGETVEINVQKAIKALEDAETAKTAEKMNSKTVVKVGKEEMTVEELAARYQALQAREHTNATEESATAAKAAAENKAENEAAPKKAELEAEKTNAKVAEGTKNFEELSNASNKGGVVTDKVLETSSSMLARGKARYGSGN